MNTTAERWHAAFILRLLLDGPDVSEAMANLDWTLLLEIARTNGVLVRTGQGLAALGARLPVVFADAVRREQERVRATLELARRVGDACEARGIAFVFPKMLQDYPDGGDDLDVLVLPRSPHVDRGILAGLRTAPHRRDMGARLAGSVAYTVAGCPSPLDVQHGRLGLVGEYTSLPLLLMGDRRRVVVEGLEFFEPSRENQLVLQGVQRVAGRRRIALCDLVFTIRTIRRAELAWGYVVATARRHGALPGLSCYLRYADQIHRDVFGSDLVPATARRALSLVGWGRAEFRQGGYRFPIVRVNGRLCLQQLGARIGHGDWAAAGRLCLVPVVGVARAVGRLAWPGSSPRRSPPAFVELRP